MSTDDSHTEYRTILGIRFFQGDAAAAVQRMSGGGLLVAPAAPALKDLETNAAYRDALMNADLVIADSAFMILIWNYLKNDSARRLSGLGYLRELLRCADARRPFNTVWVKASEASASRNLEWLGSEGIDVPEECVYLAPMYGKDIEDPELLALLERLRPQHVVVTVGGGVQERLGLYLKRRLSYRPSIHCIGAAIAFLSGDQVKIPKWADKFYLGWLFRTMSQPKVYIPRYWGARKLFALMRRYRGTLPGVAGQ
jgi:N-acetylglucosaminyldiphosphoundecaprenol N-acetyl-beta-D-mannosaminyltransferase